MKYARLLKLWLKIIYFAQNSKMNGTKILIIGLVWPEPTSSAAGTRMVQLIKLFITNGHEVIFASAASKSAFSYDLNGLGVQETEILLNDPSFDVFVKSLQPSIVLFDRFMVEEQYGWRVQRQCPEAMRILDTEDLHCLRHARQQIVKTGNLFKPADVFSDLAKREIASILRCDLSLIISEIEMNLLQRQFRIDPTLIYYLPFLENPISNEDISAWKSFEQRDGCIFIGNFLHEPNWHTVQMLKTKVWPSLRKRLPAASMNIYGAYASQKVLQLHNEKERFLVHGRAEDAREVIGKSRLLLAPIQFGAGVKGKFVDAMQVGTPSVTTTVGAEAMKGTLEWNGVITDDLDDFVASAAALYENKDSWLEGQTNGIRIINERYSKARFSKDFVQHIQDLSQRLTEHRQHNFIGQILLHHTANGSKYMSLWIEEKNRNKET
jgi:glycosyltransferase involved in cell wall biosynthesis